MTRKEEMRQNFEEHFYATWPKKIAEMSDQDLINMNTDRLQDINASYPDTMLALKSMVLTEMAMRGI